MKKLNLTMLTGIMLVSGIAQADYQCTDFSNEIKMTVNEDFITHYGNTSVTVESATEKTHYFGTLNSESGFLYKKKVVDLYESNEGTPATLTIVSKPKLCSRVSCDSGTKPVITANLNIGEAETYFSCHEINP